MRCGASSKPAGRRAWTMQDRTIRARRHARRQPARTPASAARGGGGAGRQRGGVTCLLSQRTFHQPTAQDRDHHGGKQMYRRFMHAGEV